MTLSGVSKHQSPDTSAPVRVTVLGATGSIGTNTLDLLARNPTRYDVVALTACNNAEQLALAAKKHNAKLAVIANTDRYRDLRRALSGTNIEVAAGDDAIIEAAMRQADCTIAAIVGAAGVKPVFAALAQGTRIGLANKECLVCAGDLFIAKAKRYGTQIIPVDSEHSAAFQAMTGADPTSIDKITLTASGGPFRMWSLEQINAATPEQALAHPNWSMGPKVSIDSATMMNKGLEIIEAYHLFDVDAEKIEAIVHPQSIVHCLVSYNDGSVLAQLSSPDMRTPISLALTWPERAKTPTKRLDLAALGNLTFEQPDEIKFPALGLAREALSIGASAPTVLNAANEVAVDAVLTRRIGFPDIAKVVEIALENADRTGLVKSLQSVADALEIDALSRALAKDTIEQLGKTV